MANLCCFPWSSSFSLLLLSVASLPFVTSLNFTFNFTSSDGIRIDQRLIIQGDVSPTIHGIELTKNNYGYNVTRSFGRVLYGDRIRLLDAASGNLMASFTTHFSFKISNYSDSNVSDGFAFFLAPMSEIPILTNTAKGENLGLFNDSANGVVAVEFDTYHNHFDPFDNHIGIDVYSIKSIASVALVNFSMSNRSNTAHATIKYDGGALNLSVLLSYSSEDPSVDGRSWKVSSVVDLRKYLPEEVYVGISAATGANAEAHTILSWDFNSTELPATISPVPAPEIFDRHNNRKRLLLGAVIGPLLVLCVLGLLCFVLWQMRKKQRCQMEAAAASLLPVLRQPMGPKSFTYQDLADATNNFAEKGEKEYISEVVLFSHLRPRNLVVQLIGYYHCVRRSQYSLIHEDD